jgi:CheY-like chemotaxis protein
MRLEMERSLLRAGYEVVCAEDGEQALCKAEAESPDLILLDLLMPRIGGLETLQMLKKNEATKEIPVVILSGLSEKNHDKLIGAGAEDYFEKSQVIQAKGRNCLPVLLQDVIARINRKKGAVLLTVPIPK